MNAVVGRACLDLDKDNEFIVFGDDINLCASRSPVSVTDDIAFPGEVTGRHLFAPGAQCCSVAHIRPL